MNRSSRLIELLFPDKCPFCGRMIRSGGSEEKLYCDNCRDDLIFYEQADTLPHEALDRILRLYVPMRYYSLAKKAMLRYKFNSEEWLYRPFSMIMHRFLSNNGGYDDIDIITCVPVSKKRYAKRGYDQSRLIARKLSELSGKPFRDLLERIDAGNKNRVTSAENYAQRAADRRFNALDEGLELYNARILLVDDIFTTGSTLNECGGILLEHGALYVNAACLMSGRQDIYYSAGEETA